MTILIICNDLYHPLKTVKNGLVQLVDRYDIKWLFNNEDLENTDFSTYSIIILSKSGNSWMNSEIEAKFIKYVESGGSLFVIHSGLSEYDKFSKFTHIIGGIFKYHPKQCLVKYIPKRDHVLSKNAIPYNFKDEQYFVELFTDDIDVFLHSESVHGVQPAGWINKYGMGKIGVLTPGHNLNVWLSYNHRIIIDNILNWFKA